MVCVTSPTAFWMHVWVYGLLPSCQWFGKQQPPRWSVIGRATCQSNKHKEYANGDNIRFLDSNFLLEKIFSVHFKVNFPISSIQAEFSVFLDHLAAIRGTVTPVSTIRQSVACFEMYVKYISVYSVCSRAYPAHLYMFSTDCTSPMSAVVGVTVNVNVWADKMLDYHG